MANWSYDSLWQKAKLYAERAINEDRDGPLFPLWASLALELLARATLAKVNPALLADPRDGENIMYACGFPTTDNPRSIPATTLFKRCRVIVSDFTDSELKICLAMMERRNEELHGGDPAFDAFPTRTWLAQYYRVCQILPTHIGRSLEDLFGKDEASGAVKMIEAADQKLIKEVKTAIAAAAKQFGDLDVSVQEERKRTSEANAFRARGNLDYITSCPACGGKAVIGGEKVSESPAHVDDRTGTISRNIVLLPTELRCYSCGLSLRGHASLHAAELGGNYAAPVAIDPVEYFGIEFDVEAYMRDAAAEYDDEYGNE